MIISRCAVCADKICVEACRNSALVIAGKLWTVDEVMARILPQRSFYQNSGGGVTFSGGEPLAQPDFAFALAGKIKEAGFTLGLETCGYYSQELDPEQLKLFDFVYFDLKHCEEESHKSHTGKPHHPILQNLKDLARLLGRIRSLSVFRSSPGSIAATHLFPMQQVLPRS